MIVRSPSLIITVRVAAALEQAVTDAEAKARRTGVPVDPEVAETLHELHELAGWWRARASAPATPRVDGPAETRRLSPVMLTADTAAAHLGVTGRRVRQRLQTGGLPGIRVAGRWWVDPAAVNGTGDG